MLGRSEKTGKIQRFVGHLSQEEQNMAATMKLGVHKQKKTDSLYKNKKYFCRSECDTHNLKQADRVKNYVCTENIFCRLEYDTHNSKRENRVKTT
jgi:hypothetical protein